MNELGRSVIISQTLNVDESLLLDLGDHEEGSFRMF